VASDAKLFNMVLWRTAAIALFVSLVLGACDFQVDAPDPSASPAADDGIDFRVCQIADEGGLEDHSYNQAIARGVQRAETYLGVDVLEREDVTADDLVDEVTSLADRECNMIVLPRNLGDIAAVAVQEPDVRFVAVDTVGHSASSPQLQPTNLEVVESFAPEAAYLAGYASAAATETGTLGVVPAGSNRQTGAMATAFSEGAKAFSKTNGVDVKVIVLPHGRGEGSLSIAENDPQAVAGATRTLISQGADIIFPIAGDASLGAVPVVESAGDVALVWAGENGCRSLPESCGLFLTSVVNNLDNETFDVIKSAVAGDDPKESYLGTLANSGVGIAPFNDYRDRISPDEREQLNEVRNDLIAGKI
jgi:basic membrane protein A